MSNDIKREAFENALSNAGVAANYEGDGIYSGSSARLKEFFDIGVETGVKISSAKLDATAEEARDDIRRSLANKIQSLMDERDHWKKQAGQRGEVGPVAWVTPLAYGQQVTFYKPPMPEGFNDNELGIEWYCRPLVYADTQPPTATGGVSKLTGRHHDLKTDHGVFRQSINGAKPWEIRRNDRNFKVGDTVTLYETVSTGEEMLNGASLEYTGRTHTGVIDFVLDGPAYGIDDGWCIFSLIAAAPSPEQPKPEFPDIGYEEACETILVGASKIAEAVGLNSEHFDGEGALAYEISRGLSEISKMVKNMPEQSQAAPGSGWMPTLDWGVMRCDALMEQGFDRVRLDVLKQTFLNAIEANRPNPPAEDE